MKIKEYLKNEIFRASLIILVLTFLGNLFSYLFQFLSARLLGPEDYVVIAVITSIIAIFAIPSTAIQTVLAKNTTVLNIQNKKNKIKGLLKTSLKKVFIIAIVLFMLYSLISFPLSDILNVKYSYLFLTGFFIFGALLYPVMAGIAQGMKKFTDFGMNFLINCIIKFIVGIGLILIGFKIYGAIIGFLAGTFIAFLLFFYTFRKLLKNKTENYEISIFSKENILSLIVMILFVLIFNLDVIFAKILFSSEIAGQYSVASLIGKIILFIVSSICTVLLPISSEKHITGADTQAVLRKTFFLSAIIFFIGLFIMGFFPKMVLNILFGPQYVNIASSLFYVGVAFSFISILNIFLINAIATNKLKYSSLVILGFCLGLLIFFFFIFDRSIELFSKGFMISSMISAIGGYIIYKYGIITNNAHV